LASYHRQALAYLLINSIAGYHLILGDATHTTTLTMAAATIFCRSYILLGGVIQEVIIWWTMTTTNKQQQQSY
jgi:hypothetical protein